MNRKLKIPGIYKHFKGKPYAVMGISVPVPRERIKECAKKMYLFEMPKHTEKNVYMRVYCDEEKESYVHDCKISKDILVIYKSLYFDWDTDDIYVRPIKEFLSEVDREKYPYVKRKYRFEEIK